MLNATQQKHTKSTSQHKKHSIIPTATEKLQRIKPSSKTPSNIGTKQQVVSQDSPTSNWNGPSQHSTSGTGQTWNKQKPKTSSNACNNEQEDQNQDPSQVSKGKPSTETPTMTSYAGKAQLKKFTYTPRMTLPQMSILSSICHRSGTQRNQLPQLMVQRNQCTLQLLQVMHPQCKRCPGWVGRSHH